jgi:hypothetical protein
LDFNVGRPHDISESLGIPFHQDAKLPGRTTAHPGRRAVPIVTLDEGVNFIANVVNCTQEELQVGRSVKQYLAFIGEW